MELSTFIYIMVAIVLITIAVVYYFFRYRATKVQRENFKRNIGPGLRRMAISTLIGLILGFIYRNYF